MALIRVERDSGFIIRGPCPWSTTAMVMLGIKTQESHPQDNLAGEGDAPQEDPSPQPAASEHEPEPEVTSPLLLCQDRTCLFLNICAQPGVLLGPDARAIKDKPPDRCYDIKNRAD